MCSENQGAIKELLVLQFADLRSTYKELLELGLEVGSLQKKRVLIMSISCTVSIYIFASCVYEARIKKVKRLFRPILHRARNDR